MLESGRVLNMDCMDFMREHDGKFDLILADPPYAHGMDFGNKSDARDIPKWADWMVEWMNLALTKLSPGGFMYVYGWPENLCYVMHRYPFGTFRHLVWHRLNGQLKPTNWVRSHESIYMVWNKGDKPVVRLNDIREPYTDADRAGTKNTSKVGSPWTRAVPKGEDTVTREYHPDGRYPTDVLYASVVRAQSDNGTPDGGGYCRTCERLYGMKEGPEHWGHKLVRHPTQKPMKLNDRLIKSKCVAGDGLLYVPFSGSGAECVSAKRAGVEFWATEITDDYVFLGNERLAWEDRHAKFNDPNNFELGALFDG